jgi:hypothetical protein
MIVLFLCVVLGFIGKGIYSMSNRLQVPAFLDQRDDREDDLVDGDIMSQEPE